MYSLQTTSPGIHMKRPWVAYQTAKTPYAKGSQIIFLPSQGGTVEGAHLNTVSVAMCSHPGSIDENSRSCHRPFALCSNRWYSVYLPTCLWWQPTGPGQKGTLLSKDPMSSCDGHRKVVVIHARPQETAPFFYVSLSLTHRAKRTPTVVRSTSPRLRRSLGKGTDCGFRRTSQRHRRLVRKV